MEDFVFEGLRLDKGAIVHLFAESAGTDLEHFEPGFDVTARRKLYPALAGEVK